MYFEDLYYVGFCDEINLENLKECPRKHQQRGNLVILGAHERCQSLTMGS